MVVTSESGEAEPERLGRGMRLASAIRDVVPTGLRTIAVVCCRSHESDLNAAHAAAGLLGVKSVILPTDVPSERLSALLMESGAGVVLACAEGTQLWSETGYPAIVFGDGPNVRWWRLAELKAGSVRVRASSDRVRSERREENVRELGAA